MSAASRRVIVARSTRWLASPARDESARQRRARRHRHVRIRAARRLDRTQRRALSLGGAAVGKTRSGDVTHGSRQQISLDAVPERLRSPQIEGPPAPTSRRRIYPTAAGNTSNRRCHEGPFARQPRNGSGWAPLRCSAMSPRISRAGEQLSDVLVYLMLAEAQDLQKALQNRLEEREGYRGPAWHCHIEDPEGRELTVGVLDE
jgi:hypothetical protein